MAVWSIGEIEKQRGNAIIARSFEEAADRIDRDHPRWALYDRSNDINPIHEVLSSRSTATTVPFEGGSYLRIKTEHTDVHVWSFDTKRYSFEVREQSIKDGQNVNSMLTSVGDVLAVNGGFFDVAYDHSLYPAGLLVARGVQKHAADPEGGSGILFETEQSVGITRRGSQVPGLRNAIQSGPILVEMGGLVGIKDKDQDRQNRSAICVSNSSLSVVVMLGGIRL
jgi:uncharacterized protein YigE (DUF2233 family)